MVRSVRAAALSAALILAGTGPVASAAPPPTPDAPTTTNVDEDPASQAAVGATTPATVEAALPPELQAATSFSDVPTSHPFAVEISWLVSRGIANGYPDGTYRPSTSITREAMAAFLYRAAGSPAFTDPAVSPFSDVHPADPFYTEITWLADRGITSGYSDGTFRPGRPIARDAMAAFLYRAAGEPAYSPPAWPTFVDVPNGHAFYAEIEWLNEESVTQGYADRTYRPASPVNRDAMAAFVYRNERGDARVVGNGTPASCTSAAVQNAVGRGGYITFNCGPNPITIPVTATLHTCNTDTCAHPWQGGVPVNRMVLDGGGLVTLDGQNARGIYYANSCQESFGWLSSQCNLETRPAVTFKDINLVRGNATASPPGFQNLRGGGGIAMRGGRLTLSNVVIRDSFCMAADSDGGGGAVRVTGQQIPARIYRSTFTNNSCANGGSISSLQAPMHIVSSSISNSIATGHGASSGLGGNGGAIYFDGTRQDVILQGVSITGNRAPEGGPGVFYVSNDRSGTLYIYGSTFTNNTGERFYTAPYRDIFYIGTGPVPVVSGGHVE